MIAPAFARQRTDRPLQRMAIYAQLRTTLQSSLIANAVVSIVAFPLT